MQTAEKDPGLREASNVPPSQLLQTSSLAPNIPSAAVSTTIESKSKTTTMKRAEMVATVALWVVIVLIHGACGAYYTLAAVLYHKLPTMLVANHMRAFRLVIDMKHTPTIAGFFALCAALHAVFLLEMLVMSTCRRRLVFRSQYSINSSALVQRREALRKVGPTQVKTLMNGVVVPSETMNARDLMRRASGATTLVWKASFGVTGVFGIGGKHFAALFLAREVLEAALQSNQAYYTSKYVSRMWLNRAAVMLVAVSCWSTPTIRLLTTRSRRAELLLCLLVDVVLDVASSVGVPLALGLMYSPDFDFVLTTFKFTKWADDAWVANLNSEFKQLVIQSWFDFATRLLFAVATLLSLDDVKLLAAPPVDVVLSFARRHTVGVQPRSNRFEKLLHALLVSWGVVVVALYVDSHNSKTSDGVSDCMVRVYPWLAKAPTCVALAIDCQQYEGMTGTAIQLETHWSRLDVDRLSLLVVRNCPELHIPASIQSFPALAGVYLYTSSLQEWSADAALTKYHHPNLRQITLTAVDMTTACATTDSNNNDDSASDTRSSLPPGLLSRDFPPTLSVVLIIGVPLPNLPPNLHEIWPRDLNLILMAVGFTEIPDVLLRMEPVNLYVSSNRIQRLSSAVFEVPSLQVFEINDNPLDELPDSVQPSLSLVRLGFANTNVSVLPTWMTTNPFRSRVLVTATGTPFCQQLAQDTGVAQAKSKQYCT